MSCMLTCLLLDGLYVLSWLIVLRVTVTVLVDLCGFLTFVLGV